MKGNFTRELSPCLIALILMCAPAGAQPANQQVGTMKVDGKAVFLNGTPLTTNKRTEVPIRDQDQIRTGARTSALINTGGTTVQMDQNTTITASTDSQGLLARIRLVIGQILAVGHRTEVETVDIAAVLNSTVNIKVERQGSTLTVIEGSATTTNLRLPASAAPRPTTINTYQRYVMYPDGRGEHYGIDKAEAKRTTQWARSYFKSGMPNWAKALLIIGVGAAVYEATDNDDPRPRPSQPQPSDSYPSSPGNQSSSDYPSDDDGS